MKNSRHTMYVKSTVALLMLGSCITAHAATITYTTGWNTSDGVSSGGNGPLFTDNLSATTNRSISQFDPAMGILQGITIDIYGVRLTSSASANFLDDTVLSDVAGRQELRNMSINVTMPNYLYGRPRANRAATCSGSGGVFSGASCSTNLGSSTAALTGDNATLGPLSAYIGTGNVSISINQLGQLFTDETDGDNGYVNSRSGTVSTSGSIDVTYSYSVVPVPAALWLFGSGLLGLIGVARRKKAA